MPALLTSTSSGLHVRRSHPCGLTDVSSVTSSCRTDRRARTLSPLRVDAPRTDVRRCGPLRSVGGQSRAQSLVGSGDERHVMSVLPRVDFSEDGRARSGRWPGGGRAVFFMRFFMQPVLSSSHWPRRPSVGTSRRFGTGGDRRGAGDRRMSLNATTRALGPSPQMEDFTRGTSPSHGSTGGKPLNVRWSDTSDSLIGAPGSWHLTSACSFDAPSTGPASDSCSRTKPHVTTVASRSSQRCPHRCS